MKRNGDNLIHLEFTSGPMAGQHRYFGSIIAIYDVFTRHEIGIGYDRLTRKRVSSFNPYSNSNVVIRRGSVHRKPSNRNPKMKIISTN